VRIDGPAVIEERESSCSIGPDCSFTVDRHFNLIIDIQYEDLVAPGGESVQSVAG